MTTTPNPQALPDLAGPLLARLSAPGPLLTMDTPTAARELGSPILRQLTSGAAPGGASPLRISNLGKCARALSYRIAGVPPNGRQRDARSVTTFAIGDSVEVLVCLALREALTGELGPPGWRVEGTREATGQYSVTYEQRLPGIRAPLPIPGHPDGVLSAAADDPLIAPWVERYGLTADADGRIRFAGLEVKSGASYGFTEAQTELKRGRLPWGLSDSYWWQAQGYMHALKLPLMAVVQVCKDSGSLLAWWLPIDHAFRGRLTEHLDPVLKLPPEDVPRLLPDRSELKPSKAGVYKRGGTRKDGSTYTKGDPKPGGDRLPWQCEYCSHFRTCWGPGLVEEVGRDYRGRPSRQLFVRPRPEPSEPG